MVLGPRLCHRANRSFSAQIMELTLAASNPCKVDGSGVGNSSARAGGGRMTIRREGRRAPSLPITHIIVNKIRLGRAS
jgi:hypothetical protein